MLCGVKFGRCSRIIHNWYIDFTRKNRGLDVLIPAMLKSYCDNVPADENYELAVQALLCEHGLRKVCPSMTYNWFKLRGFKY